MCIRDRRWLQFGTFNPMMRSHGTDVYREIYKFGKKGEPVYDAIEKMIGLRYSLLPYIYSTSWEVSNRQSSFMRALMMDFVDDRKVWDINDEYMFGKSLLVAPIAHAQYTPEAVVKVSEEEGWNRDGAKKTKTDVAVDCRETKATTYTYRQERYGMTSGRTRNTKAERKLPKRLHWMLFHCM